MSWEKGDTGEVKQLLLLSSVDPIFDVFCSKDAETSLMDPWTPTKALSSMSDCLNQCFLEGRMIVNFILKLLKIPLINSSFGQLKFTVEPL